MEIEQRDQTIATQQTDIGKHQAEIAAQQTEDSKLRYRIASLETAAELHRIENAGKGELALIPEFIARLKDELKALEAQEKTTASIERQLEIYEIFKVLRAAGIG